MRQPAVALGIQRSEAAQAVRPFGSRAEQRFLHALNLRLQFDCAALAGGHSSGEIGLPPGCLRVGAPLPGQRRRRDDRAQNSGLRFCKRHKLEQDEVEASGRPTRGQTGIRSGGRESGGNCSRGIGQQGSGPRAGSAIV